MRRTLPPFRWRPLRLPHISRAAIRAESTQASSTSSSRIDRITAKLPRRLQRYTNGLRNAPVSHVVSFMILHEITAVVPLFGLFGLFHYTDYVPISYMSSHFGNYVEDGLGKFERYFKRKGWFGFGKEENLNGEDSTARNAKESSQDVMERWQSGDSRYKVVVEVALAYAITKALLPLRIIGTVWATPWFAGVLMRARGVFARKA